jgi:hypothetical protein
MCNRHATDSCDRDHEKSGKSASFPALDEPVPGIKGDMPIFRPPEK